MRPCAVSLLNETFSAFIRNFLPKYGEAKADHIENLSTPIIIDQSRLGGNSRSTLGTITDINSYLRALYSKYLFLFFIELASANFEYFLASS